MRAFVIRAGFTRNETQVVIGMMAFIALVTGLNFRSAMIRSRDLRRITDIKAMAAGIDLYYAEYGSYPEEDSGEVVGCGNPRFESPCTWGMGDFKDPDGTVYMAQVPTDPTPAKSQYRYVTNVDQSKYLLMATLEQLGNTYVVPGIKYECNGKSTRGIKCTFAVGSFQTKLTEVL